MNVTALYIDSLGEGLLVRYLWCTYVCLNLELTEKTVNDDLQVKLTHTGDDGLTGLFIGSYTEGRILLGKLSECVGHLALRSLGLRLDRYGDNRLRELHGLKNDRMILIAESITSRCGLEAYRSCDITGEYLIEIHSLICMHLKQTAYTLLLTLGRVQAVGTVLEGTGVHSEVSKLTYERVGHDLKCECRERCVIR